MKRRLLALLLVLAGLAMTVSVHAETSYGDENWQVAFTQEKEMQSNFKTSDLSDVAMGLQPGDNAVITLKLQNDHSANTDWYMTNKVLSSLEDSSEVAAGGAYTYRLAYVGPDGEEDVLFDSDTVGGEDTTGGEGLHEATSSLEDFFYLDTLEKGQNGALTLEVALDGETQGNDYQDTLADLQINFAVELDEENKDTGRHKTTTVKTGDDSDRLLYIAVMAVSGLVLLLVAIYGWKENRRKKGGSAG